MNQENFAEKFESVINEFIELRESLCTHEFVQEKISEIFQEIKLKVDICEVEEGLNACQADVASKLIDLKDEILTHVKLKNSQIFEILNKKANLKETKKAIAKKINSGDVECIVENKMKSELYEVLNLESLNQRIIELEEKGEEKVENGRKKSEDLILDSLRRDFKSMKKEIKTKVDIKNLSHVLQQKIGNNFIHKIIHKKYYKIKY